MSESRQIRASDADREQAAEALREHFAAGRISEEELSDRVAAAYRATTMQEIEQLWVDLPRLPASPLAHRAELAQRRAELRPQLLQHAGGAFAPFIVCTIIWVASGASESFWPVWLLIFPVLFLGGNLWRMYGPAPQLDRVQAELARRGHRAGGRRGRHPRHRRLS
jgi:uncharacterized protein DUF1707